MKFQFGYYQLITEIAIDKTITSQNILAKITEAVQTKKINYYFGLKMLYDGRIFLNKDFTKENAAKLTKMFYETNIAEIKTESTIPPALIFAYLALKENDKAISLLNKIDENQFYAVSTRIFSKQGFVTFTADQKITLIKMVTENCTKFIKTGKHLKTFIDGLSTLNDPKYDDIIKPCLIKLNRTFYSKIGENDSWKPGLVSLQLIMKPYGL
jgi:hypothetical protein